MGAVSLNVDPLSGSVWVAALVFARVASLVMLLPSLGESGVPPRIRLALALMLAVAIGPIVGQGAPALPASVAGMAIVLIQEIVIGLAIGALARFVLAALQVAGSVIGLQSGLAVAQTFDPAQGQQSAIFASFLAITGMALIFATDTHHLFLAAVKGVYDGVPIGTKLDLGGFADAGVGAMSGAFALGLRLSAPILVFGLVFYVGMGVLSRLMPQAQVFFIAMPISVMAALGLMAATLGGVMLVWLEYVADYASQLG